MPIHTHYTLVHGQTDVYTYGYKPMYLHHMEVHADMHGHTDVHMHPHIKQRGTNKEKSVEIKGLGPNVIVHAFLYHERYLRVE